MKKLFNFIQNKVLPVTYKLGKQRHLRAIRNTFITMLPVTFFGGIIAVINAAPVTDTTTNKLLLAWASFASNNSTILTWLNLVTMGFMGLYVCIGITYYLAKSYDMEVFIPILISISGYMMLAVDPQELGYNTAITELTYLDGKGIICAFIISLLGFEFYHLMKKHNLGKIKMPKGVPPALSDSFGSLVPALIVLAVYGIIFTICYKCGTTFVVAIQNIMSPMLSSADSVWFAILVAFLLSFGWFFGIHDTCFSGFISPIEYGNLSLNAAALAAGTALPCVFTVSFWCYFGIIGGLGNCLALSILCMTSKSKQIKVVGRLGIVPAFFGISEPVTFGLPIMLNPIMFVPCILTSIVNVIITFVLMATNIVGRTHAMLSYNMPSIFGSFFSTSDFKAVILIIVLLILDMLIYFPFLKAYERQLEKEGETGAEEPVIE